MTDDEWRSVGCPVGLDYQKHARHFRGVAQETPAARPAEDYLPSWLTPEVAVGLAGRRVTPAEQNIIDALTGKTDEARTPAPPATEGTCRCQTCGTTLNIQSLPAPGGPTR
jgi:hypothetical protein